MDIGIFTIYMCACVCEMCGLTHVMAYMWKSEDRLIKSILS